MAQFIPISQAIEAIQFVGSNFFEIARFIGHGPEVLDNPDLHTTDNPVIETTEGPKEVELGDWVIKDRGMLRVVPDSFIQANYQPRF